MKVLLAFALVAAVAAIPMPEPVQLAAAPEPEVIPDSVQFADISLLPLYVPNDIVEAFQKDFENNPPLETVPEAAFAQFIAEPVQFAESEDFVHPFAYTAFDELPVFQISEVQVAPISFDVAADNEVAAEEFEPSAVNFVDAEVAEDVAAAEEIAPSAVNFVEVAEDAEVPAEAAEEIEPTAVNFEEAEIADEIIPSAVDFAEAPEAEEAEVAEIAEDIIPSAVNFAEAPEDDIAQIAELAEDVEEIVPGSVNFVDVAEDAAAPVDAGIPAPVYLDNFQDDFNAYPPKFYDNSLLR